MIDISTLKFMRSTCGKSSEQAVTLSSFGFVSCGNGNSFEAGKAGISQSQQKAVMLITPPRHMI